MAYRKHQLYLDDYEIKEGVIVLPDSCNWVVFKHVGSGNFTNAPHEVGKICLILNETRTPTSGFWSVMSFLTKEEAKDLRNQLDEQLT